MSLLGQVTLVLVHIHNEPVYCLCAATDVMHGLLLVNRVTILCY